MKYLLRSAFLAAVALAPLGCVTTPVGVPQVPEIGPVLPGVASYVVVDTHDKKVVLSHAADQKRSVASLTKIATAVVALDSIATTRGSLDEQVVIPPQAQMLGQSAVGLQPGDAISVRDALYCALLASDNVAAEALGVHVGQKIMQFTGSGSNPMAAFVAQMNALAARLHMSRTEFRNPHGLEIGTPGYSTAADIAKLTMHAIGKSDFNFIVSQKQRKVSYTSGGQRKTLSVRNTNEILGQKRIDGVKTGSTALAGPCLVITAPRPATVVPQADGSTLVVPHRLVVVALGASDRFNQSLQLLEQGWASYDAWHASGRVVQTAGELLKPQAPQAQ